MILIEEVRPRWWVLAVTIINILVPTLVNLSILLAPRLTLLLEGDNSNMTTFQTFAFVDAARGEAAGRFLAIRIAIVIVRTNDVETLFTNCLYELLYVGILAAVALLELLTYSYIQWFGFLVNATLVGLHFYMLWNIQKHTHLELPFFGSSPNDEATTPLMTGARKKVACTKEDAENPGMISSPPTSTGDSTTRLSAPAGKRRSIALIEDPDPETALTAEMEASILERY